MYSTIQYSTIVILVYDNKCHRAIEETVQITSNGWRAGITLDDFLGGTGGRRSLVMRGLSVILTLQSKFLNRVRSYVDL